MVVGKSPLTGGWGDANCGGHFGPALRSAGLDGVFVTGIAPHLVYLAIEGGQAELRDAEHLWGLDTVETEEHLKRETGRGAQTLSIGPAGEQRSLIAALITDGGRAAARSGLGAVMGAKRLKAIAARGTDRVPIHDPGELRRLGRDYRQIFQEEPSRISRLLLQLMKTFVPLLRRVRAKPTGGPAQALIHAYREYGTCAGTAFSTEIGDAPVWNWRGVGARDFPLDRSAHISDDAVIGYGNQGRAQALNLRDSGLDVIIGNREDEYAERSREDGFAVHSIDQATVQADVILLLIPDEIAPEVFQEAIGPHLEVGDVLVFSSGYNIAFDRMTPPPQVDVVLVAPRMIGAGVRDLYIARHGFPSFIGVAQDLSGRAKEMALAVAKGIGSTRAGVVEVTFAQEAELDLFTEQCFGPAFGSVLTTAVDLLLEEGYPPEAVLLELYMSGELAYTLTKIAELGMVEQGQLHSRTSQYGSMSRGMRFRLPELRTKMIEGLEEIRSGAFAEEWAAEQEEGSPTLEMLRESARSMPLYELEQALREALHGSPQPYRAARQERPRSTRERSRRRGLLADATTVLRRVTGQLGRQRAEQEDPLPTPSAGEMETILARFVGLAAGDEALEAFASERDVTTHYVLTDLDMDFYLRFQEGEVTGAMGPPPTPAEVRLTTTAEILDGMFTGRVNATRAAMSGRISFEGDTRLAMSVQRVQKDLSRLYLQARAG